MKTRAQIIARAIEHLGHTEVTSNRSTLIDGWIAACGLDPAKGYPWCAAFASWCLGLEHPCAGAIRLGHTYPSTRQPKPGDLMFFATDEHGAGHVGIVVATTEEQALCIEGNSANMIRYVRRIRSEVEFADVGADGWFEYGPEWKTHPVSPLVHVSKIGTR